MKRFATTNKARQGTKIESNQTGQKGNTTPKNKAKTRISSVTENRMMKTVRKQRLEYTDIPQTENDNKDSQATNKVYTSSSDSGTSESESDEEPKTMRVNYEVSKAYKTSINSNLSDDTITGHQFRSEMSLLKDQMKKMENGIMQEIKKLTNGKQVVQNNQTIGPEEMGTSVNTEMISASASKALKDSKVFTTNAIRAYIRDKYYCDMKFTGSEKEQEAILLDAIKVGGVKIPIDVTKREFRNYFMLQVPSCFSRLRGNSQTLCQKNWRGKIKILKSLGEITNNI